MGNPVVALPPGLDMTYTNRSCFDRDVDRCRHHPATICQDAPGPCTT
jgi:hypothetical protein